MKEEILKLRQKGHTYNKIKEEVGCSKALISYYCRKSGLGGDITNNYNLIAELSDSKKEEIKEFYKTNTYDDISKKYNISHETIRVLCADTQKKLLKHNDNWNYKRVKEHRHRIKIKAINYLGGKCKICSYDRCPTALEFHHIDEQNKRFSISNNLNKAWNKIKDELNKCILVCANCHREIHQGFHRQVLPPSDTG